MADDSTTVRKRIVEMLSARYDFEVVGEAENGKEAIELCQSLRPDVVTLDMMMPVMTGVAATEYIMAYCPTPILIVSSSTNRGELFKTYEALAAGALDVMEKPGESESEEAWEARLASTLKLISRIKVITHPRARLGLRRQEAQSPTATGLAAGGQGGLRAFAIGASTGGPAAVLELLRALPADFPLPILLVIHISKIFGSAFAQWLDGESHFRVAFVQDGEALPPPGAGQARVFMAPPDQHLTLIDGRFRLDGGPERYSCRPSVDVLFESLALELGATAGACLLTGMGRDGASGLLAMRQAGAFTVAQDEASCVVYGMPREAVQMGAAVKVLPLDQIAPAFSALARAAAP